MSEWQPIESAPKDGCPVLLTAVDQWPRVGLWAKSGYWLMVESQGGSVPYRPTHWMKLPANPEAHP